MGHFIKHNPLIFEECIDNTAAKDVVNISGPKKDDCRWGCGRKITILRRALFISSKFFFRNGTHGFETISTKKDIPIFVTV